MGIYLDLKTVRQQTEPTMIRFALLGIIVGLSLVTSVQSQEYNCDMNYAAHLGHGVIQSPNYPFNYTNGRNCRHSLYFDQLKSGRIVCFTFHRFQLETMDQDCSADYLAFKDETQQEIKYCGVGNVAEEQAYHVNSDRTNVFSNNFCWPGGGPELVVVFYSDSFVNDTGFYAEFSVTDNTAESPEEYLVDRAVSAVAPCAADQFTCFNRQCVSRELLCDGTDNCGDRSDEDYTHARCPGEQDITACDVEYTDDHCGFRPINWFRAATSPNGPRYDHTIGNLKTGFFFFNWYQNPNMATLTYEDVPLDRSSMHCLSMWYYMSGQVGALLVNITSAQQERSSMVWMKNGNQGAEWKRVEIEIPYEQFPLKQITIYRSDAMQEDPTYAEIGLDDISLIPGSCIGEDLSCRFELGFCGWENDPEAQLKWIRNKGPTESQDTGPPSDTTGFGYYAYMEASNTNPGHMARLVSHSISNVYSESKCLKFSYYMFGETVNTLRVHVRDYSGVHHNMWERFNNHGPDWFEARVPITSRSGPYQLIIEAVAGEDMFSDIAIDDIDFVDGYCTDTTTTRSPILTVEPCPAERPFLCGSGQCILEEWHCDGRYDCPDKSDEVGCEESIYLSVGAIIGICCSGAVVLVFIIMITVHCVRRRKNPPAPRSRTRTRSSIAPSEYSYSDLIWQQYVASRGDPIVEVDSQVSLDPPPPYSLPGTPGILRPQVSVGMDGAQPPPYSPLSTSGSQPRFTISIFPDEQGPPPQYAISIYSASTHASLHNTMDPDYEALDDVTNVTMNTRINESRISIAPVSNANVTGTGLVSAAEIQDSINQGNLPRRNSWRMVNRSNSSTWRNKFRLSKRKKSPKNAPPDLARAMARLRTSSPPRRLPLPQTNEQAAPSTANNNNNANIHNISIISRSNLPANRITGQGAITQRNGCNAHNESRYSIASTVPRDISPIRRPADQQRNAGVSSGTDTRAVDRSVDLDATQEGMAGVKRESNV